tara:strand:+ start:300 stop:971 length:672 start_codon:yes stop_codon:yes gene_type:complete
MQNQTKGDNMKDSFIVYRSFYLGLTALKDKDRLQLYDAIFEYGLNTREVDLKPLPKAMFYLIKPQLEANHRKFLNGVKGGRPVDPNSERQQNKNKEIITEAEPKHNQEITKAERNDNVNVNNNVKVNVNIERTRLPLKTGEDYFIVDKFYNEIKKGYPSIDIDSELKKMRVWLISNPSRQKTHVGTPRFVTSWLSRIVDKTPKPTDTYADIHKAVMDARNVRK